MNKTNTYTGIGARQTPANTLTAFTTIASFLESMNFTLRSGGADGCDSAFEAGVSDPANKEIYLPWAGFNGNDSSLWKIGQDALNMAEDYHPAWHRCSPAAKSFHARNCYQVLGKDLISPAEFIICWTVNGEVVGGTGQALRIAIAHDIPIVNFGDPSLDIDKGIYYLKELTS